MEALGILLVLYLFLALVVFPIWALIKFGDLTSRLDRHRGALEEINRENRSLRAALAKVTTPTSQPETPAPQPPPAAATIPPTVAAVATPPAVDAPPPLPVAPAPQPELAARLAAVEIQAPLAQPTPEPATAGVAPVAPPPPPVQPTLVAAKPGPVSPPPTPDPSWTERINWEQFMGAKLFAWLGGLALFLGLVFFIKYSFEHGWIPREARAAIGFVFGTGLVVGGLRMNRVRYAITSQTLIGAGVVSLYAVTFACRTIYQFPFFGLIPTFLLMSLITGAAFALAVRLESQVIAILGLLGGFLTPVLLSTGVDNPVGLFGYLALLDIGLVAVALHRRWFHLVPLGAVGTVLMMVGWAGQFYAPEKTVTAMTVCLGFSALFLVALEAARRLGREHRLLGQTAIALPAVAFCFAWFFAGHGLAAAGAGVFFGYVCLVGMFGLILAWRENQPALVAVAAAATAILIARWSAESFRPELAGTIMAVCLAFSGLYFLVYLLARRFGRAETSILGSAVALPFVSFLFALVLMHNELVGARAGLLFGFILAADVLLLALAWLDERLPRVHLAAGLVVFTLLSVWTTGNLTDALLPWALAANLLFAALHTVFPLVLERHRPAASPTWWSQLFPPAALGLMLLPIFKLATVSFLVWPAILLVDVLALALAALTVSLASVASVLVLTLLATGACLFKVPFAATLDPSLLLVIGFFALFFVGGSYWLARRLGDKLPGIQGADALHGILGDPRGQLPAFASLLPFLLLIMACARLDVPDPSAVFGLGLLLVALTLGLSRVLVIEWLPACALAGMAALELSWHTRHFTANAAGLPLAWYGGFYAIFALYPFLFRRRFESLTGPWCVAALSGLAHFPVIYPAVKLGWPGLRDILGLVPAIFALAPLGGLVAVLRRIPADQPKRLNQLAWFGGVGLFFITLIFPIQFERQWLTVAWALEGAALLWLFHRVPHPGLRATGAVLLVTAFARLALNPAVLGYHVRGGAVFNWYLYTYGLAIAALFAGARLLAPPREQVLGFTVPPLFDTLGTILAFLLLNIEIADFFTPPGTRALTFQFSGDFARDMSYTIGWALFALGLLLAGLWKQLRAARQASIALLGVALLKLFFHDLARLEAFYRIGALLAVAAIAIVSSFAYQRFLPDDEKSAPPVS
ncbi:MAG TPA: DUF2339 domain-containing protein [Lacunisphaera sp.]|nr:DUF2339 domain-containing protein [Lacunisphaera sp.]